MKEDIKKRAEEVDDAWDDALEHNRELADGLVEGKVVAFQVADGKAVYEVVDVGEKISIVERRDDMMLDPDAYHSSAVDHETGEILTSTLRTRLHRFETLNEYFFHDND